MPDQPDKIHNLDIFQEKYARPSFRTVQQIARDTLGHEAAAYGYTSIGQAQTLCEAVNLTQNNFLLDLGCGHGWPGFHVAQFSGCNLISSDQPSDALHTAKDNAKPLGIAGKTEFVAASGGALPFQPGFFDAIVHSDVFC